MNKHKLNTSNKTANKQLNPGLNHHSIHGRRSRPLGQVLPTYTRRWNSSGHKQQISGFTIIEVVLVLAIAGLIFLMVFIALPALQRNQRDAQRKQDLSRVLTAVRSYQSTNRGRVPAAGGFSAILVPRYLSQDGQFQDPDGSQYLFSRGTDWTGKERKSSDGKTIVRVYRSSRCDGENIVPKTGQNNIALTVHLEGGGVYCVNN